MRTLRTTTLAVAAVAALSVTAACSADETGDTSTASADTSQTTETPAGEEPMDAAEVEAFQAPVRQQYEDQGSPLYSTARLWDDGVIDPADTRTVLGLGISIAYNAPIPRPKFGVFRM